MKKLISVLTIFSMLTAMLVTASITGAASDTPSAGFELDLENAVIGVSGTQGANIVKAKEGGEIAVIADPTNAGRGKILQVKPVQTHTGTIKASTSEESNVTAIEGKAGINKFTVPVRGVEGYSDEKPLTVVSFDYYVKERGDMVSSALAQSIGNGNPMDLLSFGGKNTPINWHNGLGLQKEDYAGNRIGTADLYATGKWISVKKVYDGSAYNENSNVMTYIVDGERKMGIKRNAGYSSDWKNVSDKEMFFDFETVTGNSEYYFDNIKVERMAHLTFSDFAAKEDGTVTFKASAPVDAATLQSALKVKANGTEVAGVTAAVAENGTDITLTIPGATIATDYTLTVNRGYAAKSGAITAAELSQTVTTPATTPVITPSAGFELDLENAVIGVSGTQGANIVKAKEGGEIAVIADPTNAGRGKILQVKPVQTHTGTIKASTSEESNVTAIEGKAGINKFTVPVRGVEGYSDEKPLTVVSFDYYVKERGDMVSSALAQSIGNGNPMDLLSFGGKNTPINWHNGLGLQKEDYAGNRIGTADLYATGKWISVKKVYDGSAYNENSNVMTYIVDGERKMGIKRNAGYSSDWKNVSDKEMFFDFETVTGNSEYYFDNIKVERMAHLTFSDFAAKEDGTVTFKASAPVDAATLQSALKVKANGTEVAGVTAAVAENGTDITLTIPGATIATDYTLTVNRGYAAKSGAITAAELSQTVTTPRSSELWISSAPTYTKGTNSITVSDLAVKNESSTALNGWLVVAAYNSNNALIGVKAESLANVTGTVSSTINTIALNTPVEDIAYVHAFLWNSSAELVPYHGQVEVTLAQ